MTDPSASDAPDPTPDPTVEVIGGVAVRAGRIFLAQRPGDKDFPFTWECPGGKVDGNESHHSALRREWMEEFGVEVGGLPEQALWSDYFDSPVMRAGRGKVFLLFYYIGPRLTGTPVPREGQGCGWFTESEMMKLTLAPGNQRAIRSIAEAVFPNQGPRRWPRC